MAGTDEAPSTPHSPGSAKSNNKPPRPKIILPPPQINIQPNPMYTASIPMTPNTHPDQYVYTGYPTRAGEFMFKQFSGFKDFTFNTAKSGMSFGEKIAFWMYNKVSSLSKQWFTHFFLFLMILLYSVGGAFLFVAIEGHDEEITVENVRRDRLEFLQNLKEILLEPQQQTTEEETVGKSLRALLDYEDLLYSHWSGKQLVIANRGPKIWTFWNAVFYCGTIYTTIEVVSDGAGEVETSTTRRFEGKVTPEQELSASVARKRRNISKKRSASVGRPRDQTPVRELDHAPSSAPSDEEPPPKTPERRKSKSRKASLEDNLLPSATSSASEEVTDKPKAKDDVSSLLNRAKQSVTKEKSVTRLRKDVKKAAIKRSQSAPRPKVETSEDKELVESFKKAQLMSAAIQLEPLSLPEEKKPQRPTSIPLYSNILRRRKLEEERLQSEDRPEKPKPPGKRYTFREIRAEWKQFKQDHSKEYNIIGSMRNRCFNDTVLLMIFCGLGGLMFKFTEGAFENFYKCGVKRVKRDFIDALWRGSHHLREDDWKSMARTKLRDFEEQLHTAHEAGVTSYSGQRSWSFLNGIVYALTIVTTIGYGHMYPTTTTGMALTIVYAIIGIPLFLIILTDFGKLFTRAIKFLWAFVRRLYYTGTCKQARKVTAVQEVMKGAQMVYEIATFRRPSQFNLDEEGGPPNGPPKFPAVQPFPAAAVTPHSRDGDTEPPDTPAPSTFEIDDDFNLPVSVALFLLISYIFLGAVVYYVWERWDFFASFYFVFISMSTIGFGDYVPRHPICMIVSIIYLVFGLALMSMCINVVQVKLSDTFRQASAKLGATIGLRVAEEDGSITTVPPPQIEIADVHASMKSI